MSEEEEEEEVVEVEGAADDRNGLSALSVAP